MRNGELLVSGRGRTQTTKGRGAVMVMIKGTGLTMVTVASMPRLWVSEDMKNWVTWTRSEIDGGGDRF